MRTRRRNAKTRRTPRPAAAQALLQEQEVLLLLSETLLGPLEPEAIARAAFPVIRDRLDTDAASLYLPDARGEYLELVAADGATAPYVGQVRFPVAPPESSGAAWALHTRRPVFEDDTQTELPFALSDLRNRADIRASLRVPMLSGDRPVGVIIVTRLTLRPFSQDDARFLSLVAGQVAIALERAREHQATKHAEIHYRSLFEGLPIGAFRTTPAAEVLDANPALVQLMGYPGREAYMARGAAAAYADPQERQRILARLHHEGIVRNYEARYRRGDGTIIWGRLNVRAVRDKQGEVLFYEGTLEDITARKQTEEALQESEERFRRIFEDAPIGMSLVDPAFRRLKVNRAFCEMLGYTEEELTARTFADNTYPEDAQEERDHGKMIFSGALPEFHREKRFITRNGDVLWCHISARGIRGPDGKIHYALCMVENITERKRTEESLRQLYGAEQRARTVAETLRAANLALTQILHLDTVLEMLLNYLARLVPYDTASVMLVEDYGRVVIRAFRGYEQWTTPDLVRGLTFDARVNPIIHTLLTTRRSCVIAETAEYPGWETTETNAHIRNWLGVPMIAVGTV